MDRRLVALLLVPIVLTQSCARAGAAGTASRPIIVKAVNRISLRPGPALTSLQADQRFRFVPPDSLTIGLATADADSFYGPEVQDLRLTFASVMERGRWRESRDSAQFDVTIFTTARVTMRRERSGNVAASTAACSATPTQAQRCTDDAALYTEVFTTEFSTVHIIRRRSDGAVRVWLKGGAEAAAAMLEQP